MPAITAAVARASSASPTRPPPPATTSMWIAPAPPAIAPLITEAATRPPEGAVPVASRRARRRRSPGTRRGSGATTAIPTSRTWRTKPARLSCERKPGIASSLSTAPPVWARLRPPRLATRTPSAAASGAATRGVVSPTPPVVCGSPVGPREASSRRSPDATRARARAAVWSAPRPRRQATMDHAAIRASEAVPSSHARTNASTLSASTGSARRLRSMSSTGARGAAMVDRDSTPAARRW